jgi:hypothetical protein
VRLNDEIVVALLPTLTLRNSVVGAAVGLLRGPSPGIDRENRNLVSFQESTLLRRRHQQEVHRSHSILRTFLSYPE